MKLSKDIPISKKALEALGFTIPDHEDKNLGNGMLERDDIMIWDPDFGEGWISWALDQGGLEVRFQTLGDLNNFWIGCQRPPLFQDNESGPEVDTKEVESEIDRLNGVVENLESNLSGLSRDFEKLKDEFNSVRYQVTGEDTNGMVEDREPAEDPLTESDVERIAERIAEEVFSRNQQDE